MPTSFRIASFNAENLFSRARVFNIRDKSIGDQVLKAVEELDRLLRQPAYSPEDKKRIVALYLEDEFGGKTLAHYIEIREDRGKLFKKRQRKIVGIAANGCDDWDGTIEFVRSDYSEAARENTAKVIKAVKADIACMVEVENRPALVKFNSEMLDSKRFDYALVIDGNDLRGIDVGLLSNFALCGIWTHIYDGTPRSRIFSRDCLEVELQMPDGGKLFVLCNHFKSRGYGVADTSDKRRRLQAERVCQILAKYDLTRDRVVVAGDLNDSPDRPPYVLTSLLAAPHLSDVLALQYPDDPSKRWTYHYERFEQIDYVLVSEPLRNAFKAAGIERRGIYQLAKLTNGAETEFTSVSHWTNAASDHGAVWAEFEV